MTKTVNKVTFVATSAGFYDGHRVRRGETFVAPEDEKFGWAHKAGAEDVAADTGGSAAILEKSGKDIVAALAGLTDVELNSLVSAEQAGKGRKAVLAAIEDERANRVGRIGNKHQNPAAKQPEEKDPIVDPLS